jgi:hypothetical protein
VVVATLDEVDAMDFLPLFREKLKLLDIVLATFVEDYVSLDGGAVFCNTVNA